MSRLANARWTFESKHVIHQTTHDTSKRFILTSAERYLNCFQHHKMNHFRKSMWLRGCVKRVPRGNCFQLTRLKVLLLPTLRYGQWKPEGREKWPQYKVKHNVLMASFCQLKSIQIIQNLIFTPPRSLDTWVQHSSQVSLRNQLEGVVC